VKKRWIPVCPSCQQVVNFETAQCINPDCRILLTWQDKVIYAEKLYGEAGQDSSPLPEVPAKKVDPTQPPVPGTVSSPSGQAPQAPAKASPEEKAILENEKQETSDKTPKTDAPAATAAPVPPAASASDKKDATSDIPEDFLEDEENW
jgi:hypothetical protein